MNKINHPLSVEANSFSSFKSLSKGIGLFVIGVGCLVLVGWALDIAVLKSILPGLASMKSNAALLFVLCGISLWMQVNGQTRPIAQACAFIVAFVALLTLGEYLFNTDFGIDELLFRDTAAGALYPGRMAPVTAMVFLMISLALMFLDRQPKKPFNESLLIIAFAISMLALIGYIYGVSSLYKIGEYTSMALHTALNFILLSISILFARPERSLLQTILADTAGGNILRRFLPVVIVGPILLGWVRLWGQRAGLYDTAFGLVLMVVSIITTLTIFIWFNARQLTNINVKRKQMDDSLLASELRFRSTLESMMEGCQIIGYDWRYLFLNDSAVKQSQIAREKLLGHTMMECYPGIENSALFATLQRCMDERTSHHMANEFIYPNSSKGWFELSIQPAPDGIFILSSNITEHKQAEEEILKLNAELEEKVAERTSELAAANKLLHELAIVDELTGLYNRRGFLLHAEQQLLLARRTKCNLLIFYGDLDGLKQINDHFGHIAGDKALVMVARALHKTFRNSDIKARLGGDEFIVLAMEAEEHGAQILLARLRKKLAENNQSMSVGIVTFDAQNEISVDDLIAHADEAMYAEKRTKLGRHEI